MAVYYIFFSGPPPVAHCTAAILGMAAGLHPPEVRHPERGRRPRNRRAASFPPEIAEGKGRNGAGAYLAVPVRRTGAIGVRNRRLATQTQQALLDGIDGGSEWDRHRHQQGPGKEQTVVSAQLYCGVSL